VAQICFARAICLSSSEKKTFVSSPVNVEQAARDRGTLSASNPRSALMVAPMVVALSVRRRVGFGGWE